MKSQPSGLPRLTAKWLVLGEISAEWLILTFTRGYRRAACHNGISAAWLILITHDYSMNCSQVAYHAQRRHANSSERASQECQPRGSSLLLTKYSQVAYHGYRRHAR